MLSWIPILGPIIDGLVSVYKQFTNTEIQKVQINSTEDIAFAQTTNQLTQAFVNDIGVRLCRDIIMFPGSVYCGTIIWDRFMDLRHPELVWGVLPLQGAMEYLPFALLTFFFGSAYLYWKRK